MLPLDLHVLSLPLAFILSQDQTLRCKKLLTLITYLSVLKLFTSNTSKNVLPDKSEMVIKIFLMKIVIRKGTRWVAFQKRSANVIEEIELQNIV